MDRRHRADPRAGVSARHDSRVGTHQAFSRLRQSCSSGTEVYGVQGRAASGPIGRRLRFRRLSLLIITPCSWERIGLAGRHPDAGMGSRFGRKWRPHFQPDPAPSGIAVYVLTDRPSIPQAGWTWSKAGGPPPHEPVGDPHPSRSPARQSFSCSWGNHDRPQASLPRALKPFADESVVHLPSAYRSRRSSASERAETPEEPQVVRSIHPKTEPVPVPIGSGAGEVVRRSGFRSAWTARRRRSPSHRQLHFARSV